MITRMHTDAQPPLCILASFCILLFWHGIFPFDTLHAKQAIDVGYAVCGVRCTLSRVSGVQGVECSEG